jgi:hypothetical protein
MLANAALRTADKEGITRSMDQRVQGARDGDHLWFLNAGQMLHRY